MYFVKIPNPVNTLSDIVSFAAVIRVVTQLFQILTLTLRSDPRGYSTNFYTGRLRTEVQPLTHLYTIFHEKDTPSYTFYSQTVPLSHSLFRTLHPF